MDAIQATTFSALAAARVAEPATLVREQTQDESARVQTASRNDGLGAGHGAEAAQARQAAGQEAAPSHESNSTGQPPPDKGGKGSIVNLLA